MSDFPIDHPHRPPLPSEFPPLCVKREEGPTILGGGEEDPIDVDGRFDLDKCRIDHISKGFDDQTVYIWQGTYKGKLALVKQVNAGLAKVQVESAIFASSIMFIEAKYLLACVLISTCITNADV